MRTSRSESASILKKTVHHEQPMNPFKLFCDREDAGRKLGARLQPYRDASPIVYGLTRGGVPVAYEVARELGAQLDICVVRKIGAPVQPELGIGAVAEGGSLFLQRDTITMLGIEEEELEPLIEEKLLEVDERVRRFRRGTPPLDARGRTVILVDDGIATGGTARAAIDSLRKRGAGRIVFAVPVGAAQTVEDLASSVDDMVCLHAERLFFAVGLWYDDFAQTTDEMVVELVDRANAEWQKRTGSGGKMRGRSERVASTVRGRNVQIPIEKAKLEGALTLVDGASGLVLFAHGSGSSRHSARNRYVAGELQYEGISTLLFDLLTADEERIDALTGHLRFDIPFLARRLLAVTDWVLRQSDMNALPIGYFGASTGAAAALMAAAERPSAVHAVVSRGGRPDLAQDALPRVHAATLLLVGGADEDVLGLNREALDRMTCEKKLEIVAGATHLFPERGALEHVARSAAHWFGIHLSGELQATG